MSGHRVFRTKTVLFAAGLPLVWDGGSMQSLIVALLSGESFLYRVPQPTEPTAASP